MGTATGIKLKQVYPQAAYTVLANITGSAAIPGAASVAEMKTLLAYAIGDLATIAANTVVANATAGVAAPAALVVAASTFVGRIASGNVIAMTVAQAKTLLAYAIGDLATVAANTVMVNATSGSAVITAMAVAASTFVGRIASGNIIAMTVAQAQTLLGCALLAGATYTGAVLFRVGTATAGQAPAYFQGTGVLLGTPVAGAIEYDSINSYITNETTSGRGAIPVEQHFKLTAAGGTITTIANFFGTTSNIPLVASAYYIIEMWLYFLKSTASTVVITLTNSVAPTGQDIWWESSPITGAVAPPGDANMLCGQVYNDATAAKAITTGSLSDAVNHFIHIRIHLKNGTGTSLKIQATATSGNITPGIGSMWVSKRISASNVGAFVA
jgi:hypothetical protein